MSITLKDAQHVAKLANLALKTEELELYTKQLNAVLDYAQQLQTLDTQDIPPTFNSYGVAAILREDEVQQFENKQQLLANGPKTADNSFVVPRIL
jgi:aspartyl-tRNA(Asn)/glutamyl-tRNA(Gln) amidotransferase subunit C